MLQHPAGARERSRRVRRKRKKHLRRCTSNAQTAFGSITQKSTCVISFLLAFQCTKRLLSLQPPGLTLLKAQAQPAIPANSFNDKAHCLYMAAAHCCARAAPTSPGPARRPNPDPAAAPPRAPRRHSLLRAIHTASAVTRTASWLRCHSHSACVAFCSSSEPVRGHGICVSASCHAARW